MAQMDHEELLARFREYLQSSITEADDPAQSGYPDQAMDTATNESGFTPDQAPNLFTLLAELLAVKNEIRLESRQVKSALEAFQAVFEQLSEAHQRLQTELDRQRERSAQEVKQAQEPLLRDLLDLRDRLQAGEQQAQRYAPSWLARRGGADRFVSGMAEGMSMNLRHLDGLLQRFGIRPMEILHQPFEPHGMRAVATEQDAAYPSGVVLEVVRPGYQRDGQVFRPAEVIVNKRNSAS